MNPQSNGKVTPSGSGRDIAIASHRGSYFSLSCEPRGASTTTWKMSSLSNAGIAARFIDPPYRDSWISSTAQSPAHQIPANSEQRADDEHWCARMNVDTRVGAERKEHGLGRGSDVERTIQQPQ